MPWLSIDFKDDHKKATLGSKFGVCELPTLVVCDHNGKVVKNDARDQVQKGAKVLEEWNDEIAKQAAGGDTQPAADGQIAS
jgi:hypothetical protein